MSAPTPGHDMPAMPISPFIPPSDARPRRSERSRLERIPLAPAEGWLTILLIVLLVLPLALSISDARYVLGRSDLTGFLPLAALLGVSWGMLGAKVGWGRWRTHLLGAAFAALILPILVGSVIPLQPGDLGPFGATARSTVDAILDLSVRQRSITQQYGHYLLVLGIIVWATGQFAGYATLGHRRPLGAVFVTGLVLLTNMAITPNNQLSPLVLFSLAALFLLVRLHADEERQSWIHRRIGDPAAVTSLYLRGGSAFVSIAVVGAFALTTMAASAPLASTFSGLNEQLVDIGQQFQPFLPVGGPGTRISGVAFGPNALITGEWVDDRTEAIEIDVPPGDTTPYYWRARTYDKFAPNKWSISEDVRVSRQANTPLLDATGDAVPSPDERRQLTFTVKKIDFARSTVFAPDAPATVSVDTSMSVIGPGQYFGGLDADNWSTYTATALVPVITKDGSSGLTENELRVAPTDYPDSIKSLYLATPPDGTIGPQSKALLAEIQAQAAGTDPYDQAVAAVNVMRNPQEFHYATNINSLVSGPCQSLSTVECFATYKTGFCQYFATTMALLLREEGIPTRYVQGWLPGTRDAKTGIEPILRSNSHAWVEVYFPGYGWYPFDPTPAGSTQPPRLPAGPKVAPKPSASARPRASAGDIGNDRTIRPAAGAGTTTQRPSGPSPAGLIVVAALLLVTVGLLAFLAYRRGPRGPTHPETAWRGVVGLASRFGWAPRPNQTPFEYAGALSEVIPVARPDLYTVATARVEVVYGRHSLDADRLARVRQAQRRLRVTLLRLIVRRPTRPRIRLR